MAHRIKATVNSTNLEGDTFSSRMRKQQCNVNVQKCPKNCSASCIKDTNPAFLCTFSGQNFKPKPAPTKLNQPRKSQTADDNAPSAGTTRARSRGRPRTVSPKPAVKESWSKLLQPNKPKESTQFNNFDPLRALHFIGKELQSKLNSNSIRDPNVLQMVKEMEVVLNRIPPDVVSVIKGRSNAALQEQEGVPEKLMSSNKPTMVDNGCLTRQNNFNLRETENFHRQLEASTHKLDIHCKYIESQLGTMKKEKEEVEHQLTAERDIVKFLRKKIEDIQQEKMVVANGAYQELLKERDSIRNQLKKRETSNDAISNSSAQEFKCAIQELQTQTADLKRENLALRHKLAISNMERDKFIAILNIRDSQISEIRQEMAQLQDAVNDQLCELQKSPYLSGPSSQSTILGDNVDENLWQQVELTSGKPKTDKETTTAIHDAYPSYKILGNSTSILQTFHDLPSCDSSSNTNLDCTNLKMNRNGCELGSPQKDEMLTNGKGRVERIYPKVNKNGH